MSIGKRLWIVPSWHEPPVPDSTLVRLDPGMAFGTGQHPTTRTALELLQRIPARAAVLDAGCGSGVLAIAARRLRFGPVVAIDFDAHAVDLGADLDAGALVAPYRGTIDDVRIYDRALSSTELQTLAGL